MTIDNLLDNDFNPLFILLNTKAWSASLQQLKSDPSLAEGVIKLAGFYGDKKVKTSVNALHIACKNNAPIEVIEALLSANDLAASQKDSSYQRLPLHVATLNCCSFRVVGALTKECPRAARIQDIHGRLPIHFACKNRASGERSLRYLLKVYPESTGVADDQGFLPLHVACRSSMPMVVINMLLRISPDSILAKTNNGATPVHCAKNVKGKGEAQDAIVDLLKRVAEETKKMSQGPDGGLSSSATVLTSRNATTVRSDYGLLRSIGKNPNKAAVPQGINVNLDGSSIGVPGAVAISEHSTSTVNLTEGSEESEPSLM